jgi:ATP-dependent DNA helicase RecG
MADDPLQTPLQFLKGVGPRKAADLEKAGLRTVEDLLVRFPRRFEDRSRFQPIASLRAGGSAAILGEILTCGVSPTRRQGFALFTALVQDESGQVKAVWPNQKFLKDVLKPKMKVVLFGRTAAACSSPRPSSRCCRTTARASRCTPAASCRSTSARDRSRPTCTARSCIARSRH